MGALHTPDRETVLDPHRLVHLGIWRDELDDLTRRFFRWEVPALDDEQRRALAAGVREDVVGMGDDDLGALLERGHLPVENGLARTASGRLAVAVWTAFPGATPPMIDWWFGWHLTRTERYKLWHPQAHLFTQPRWHLEDVEGLDDRERYVGNTSWVDEFIGPLPTRLAISFVEPEEFGLDEDDLDRSGHGTAVCARTADSDNGVDLGTLVHAVRWTPWGCEMRSRFLLPVGAPDVVAVALFDHCATEMAHLAGFLPQLHAAVTVRPPRS